MTELVTLKQEHQTAASLYGQTQHLTELFDAVRKIAPWANGEKPMSDIEISLVVRKAVAMGLDPLNQHEVQIWKDNRGSVNFQIAYPLQIEWVRHFHGEHTEPQYRRLIGEELRAEGLLPQDIAYRVTFLMKKDLPGLSVLVQSGYDPSEARAMLEVTGMGVALAGEYNGQYFAPNGRSKSWKVQKRALTDAYRRKFGDPTRFEIEELRRIGGISNLRPEDWEDGAGLAPDDAQSLAKSTAGWREHNEAMANDLAYRDAHEKQTAVAADSLWGAPIVDGDYKGLDPVGDAEMIEERKAADAAFDEAADAAMVARMVAGLAMETEEKTAEAKTETPLGLSAAPFTTPEAAIAWGAQQGAFGGGNGAGPHARAAYNKLKTEKQPKDAAEMAALWRADVARRLAEAQA